jgi:thiaminase (transcriptional activator TenA)
MPTGLDQRGGGLCSWIPAFAGMTKEVGTAMIDHAGGGLFSRLVEASGEAWPAYTRHEFVLRLAAGDLREASFRHYLVQDYLFLLHFTRAWGLAVYKSDSLAEMRRAQHLVATTLDVEIGLHIDYCRSWGLSQAKLETEPEAAATVAYTRFVLDRGLAGDRLDLETALAPCILGYAEIAAERLADPRTRRDNNPYRSWLDMYSGPEYQQLAAEARQALDELFARRGGPGRFPVLANDFARACQLEAAFWQMGLDLAR